MVLINGIDYKKPKKPTVVVCMDGISPEYLEKAIDAGKAPTFEKFREAWVYHTTNGVIPSFTNPNNISIVTGVLPDLHGITTSGQSFNRGTGKYELIYRPDDVRCNTLLKALYDNGIKVASITTKDKLRFFLSKGWQGINISAEVAHQFEGESMEDMIKKAIEETREGHLLSIVEDPDWMYSENSSFLSLDLAIALLQGKGPYIPELIYVSLTDYILHRNAPGTNVANNFIRGIDKRLGQLDEAGCVMGVTADHGMNDKHNPEGSPNTVWLKDFLDKHNIQGYHIVLACADKYQGHHGSLGSAAWIYFDKSEDIGKALVLLKKTGGIEEALPNAEAVHKYSLPSDAIGDIFLLSSKDTVIGTTESEHPNVPKFLRSHGGLHEQEVPFIINRPLNKEYESRITNLRNFNIFEFVLNGVI